MFKVIIAGGRDFEDFDLLSEKCDYYFQDLDLSNIEIVSGTANGADKLGERYAYSKSITVKQFPPDWGKYGTAAGPIRNRQMASYADALIAFHTGGKGTTNMIQTARELGLAVRVVNCRR